MTEDPDIARAWKLLRGEDLAGSASAELGGRDVWIPPGTFPPGVLIGEQFRLLGRLGSGGMGTVYLAEDEQVGRRVALKFLSLRQEVARKRFAREAEVTARLQHPNVIRIFSSGEHEGQHYLVYELIEGAVELGEYWTDLGLEGRLDLLEQVACGLGAAHAEGIVHRDLKPENVLIAAEGRALVADFGLAGVDASSLTKTGQVLGTPAYMSPEQIRGLEPAPTWDVWALGLLLYEAVYGEHAFFRPGSTLQIVMIQILEARFEVPTTAAPALRRLILASLSLEPDRRPRDASAFLADLQAARASQPRPRAGWIAAGICLAGVLALSAVALGGEGPSPVPTRGREAALSSSPPLAAPSLAPSSARQQSSRRPEASAPDLEFRFGRSPGLSFRGPAAVLLVQQNGRARYWNLGAEVHPRGDLRALVRGTRHYRPTVGPSEVLLTAESDVWLLAEPDLAPTRLPAPSFPVRFAEFVTTPRGERYVVLASKETLAWGPLTGPLRERGFEGAEIADVAGGAALVLLTKEPTSRSSHLLVVDPATGEIKKKVTPGVVPNELALSPGGDRVALSSFLGSCVIQDLDTERLIPLPGHHRSTFRSVCWSAGHVAAVSGHELSVWRVGDEPQRRLSGRLPPGEKADEVYLSPDAKLLIVERNGVFLGWRLPRSP